MAQPVLALKERRRDQDLRRLYGISLATYRQMFALGKGLCWICDRPPKRSLHVDHDHKTGVVRGLLCFLCNRKLIGRRRDPRLFERAADYLKLGVDFRDEAALARVIQASATAEVADGGSAQPKSSVEKVRRPYVQRNAR